MLKKYMKEITGKACKCDEISSQVISEQIFDIAVNCGNYAAVAYAESGKCCKYSTKRNKGRWENRENNSWRGAVTRV